LAEGGWKGQGVVWPGERRCSDAGLSMVRVIEDTAMADHVVLTVVYKDFSFVDGWIAFASQSISIAYS